MGLLINAAYKMLTKVNRVNRYLKYYFKSKTKFGIHSPFVFDFITNVLEDQTQYQEYEKVEEQRNKLLHNRNQIEIVDFGILAGKRGYTTSIERIKDIAKRTSISAREGQLLFRIVRNLKPEIMLEMGTSLGISSIYQAAASPDSFFIGIEGCAATAAIAEENLGKFSEMKNYSIVIGNFNVMLPNVLSKLDKLDYAFIDGNHAYKPTLDYFNKILPYTHERSVLILHDIYWSDEMEQAWNEIKSNPLVSATIDIFSMGIVFFRKGIPKQDFIIKF